ncbi:MAG: outer membrane protein assembly factor BamA, partial [Alphaproteobacteria bacterium]|nr:outer membrane protein assembly factor BamA [Alphaproteobacteria bacterium]
MTDKENFPLLQNIFLAILLVFSTSISAYAGNVKKIDITGSQRIEPSTIATYMNVGVGDTIDGGTTDRILKNLFATGLFADVSVDEHNGVIEVNVVENPVISEIAFEGNKSVADEELLAEIQMRPRQVYTRTKVQSDTSRLYQIYRRQGRFSVSIEPKVIRRDQNRVDLIFEINEGGITKVESIRFVGNKHYDDGKLRGEISTKERAWYRFISNDDRYDPDRLAYDQELLRNFYLSKGYADFQVLSATAELSNNKKGFFITITVEEGERYKVTGVEFVSAIGKLDTSLLQDSVEVEINDWYNANDVRDSITSITDTLGDMQYAFVNVVPDIRKNDEDRTIVVVFRIDETPRAFVERINFNGNIRTLDKVLRREMELVEGDPFNRSKLADSERKLRNLDFFDLVNVDVKKGSAPDKTILDVDVQEKSTGELSIGAGFSSSDGPLADLRVRERNLLG